MFSIRVNACPVLAPVSTLRNADAERLAIDRASIETHRRYLNDHWTPECETAVSRLFAARRFPPPRDIDESLYGGGFFGHHDKRLFAEIRTADPQALSGFHGQFDDPRGNTLLFRYRARNYPDTLTDDERQQWAQHVVDRLDASGDDVPWQTFDSYRQTLDTTDWTASEATLEASLRDYGDWLRQRYPRTSRQHG